MWLQFFKVLLPDASKVFRSTFPHLLTKHFFPALPQKKDLKSGKAGKAGRNERKKEIGKAENVRKEEKENEGMRQSNEAKPNHLVTSDWKKIYLNGRQRE